MEQGKRLVLNSILNALSPPISLCITILLTPYVLHHLGKSVFGIWSLVGSVLAYSALLRLGLSSAVNLHIPKLHHRGDTKGINQVVTTSFGFYLVSSVLIVILVAILTWGFPDWWRIEDAYRSASRWVVVLAGGAIVLSTPLHVFSGVISGIQRFDLMVGPTILLQVVRALGIVVAFQLGFGLIALTGVTAATTFMTAVIIAWFAYRTCPGLSLNRDNLDWSRLPGMVAYSLSTLLYASGQIIQMQSGKAMAGLFFDTEAVTEFTLPFTLLMMVSGFVANSTKAVKPAVSSLDAQDKTASIQQTFLMSTKYAFLVAAPASAAFLLHGEAILAAWLGRDYLGESGTLLAIMTVPAMLRTAHMAGFFVLAGLGRHKAFGALVLGKALTSVLLTWVLCRRFGMGLEGVAIGFSVPELIVSGFLLPIYLCGGVDLRVRDELVKCVVPAVVATIPFLLYCIAARVWFPIESRLELVVVFGISAIPLFAGIWYAGFDAAERLRFGSYAKSAMRRFLPGLSG